jgi:hypothetical protein
MVGTQCQKARNPTTWGWLLSFYYPFMVVFGTVYDILCAEILILSDLTSVQMTWHRLPKSNKGGKTPQDLPKVKSTDLGGFLRWGLLNTMGLDTVLV